MEILFQEDSAKMALEAIFEKYHKLFVSDEAKEECCTRLYNIIVYYMKEFETQPEHFISLANKSLTLCPPFWQPVYQHIVRTDASFPPELHQFTHDIQQWIRQIKLQ